MMRIEPGSVIAPMPGTTASNSEKVKLRKATQQFEAFFLNALLKSMRKTIQASGLNKSSSTRVYTEMMDEALADNMSRTNKFGLGEMLYRKLEKTIDATVRPTQGNDGDSDKVEL